MKKWKFTLYFRPFLLAWTTPWFMLSMGTMLVQERMGNRLVEVERPTYTWQWFGRKTPYAKRMLKGPRKFGM